MRACDAFAQSVRALLSLWPHAVPQETRRNTDCPAYYERFTGPEYILPDPLPGEANMQRISPLPCMTTMGSMASLTIAIQPGKLLDCGTHWSAWRRGRKQAPQ